MKGWTSLSSTPTGAAALLLAAMIGAVSALPACSEEVRHEHLGLALLANLEGADAKPAAEAPLALIVHGTLAHHGMEVIKTLQAGLKERGLSSLAITLSLGLDARRGMLGCGLEHDHRASDAAEEIAAWVGWLKDRGRQAIALIGHSRGAQQVAHYAVGAPDQRIERLVLIAPLADPPEAHVRRYAATFAGDLPHLLAAARKHVTDGEEDTVMEVPGFLNCRNARVTAAAFLDYYDPEPARSALELAARVQRPILIIAAGADEISPDLAARAHPPPGPHTSLEIVDGADHFFRDLFADDLADKVAAFLRQR